MTPGAISRSKGVHSVSDKDADAKNYKKCRNSFEHGRSKRLCSSKQLRWLHSQNDSPVAPTFSACLVILSNGLDLAFIAPSVRQMIACIWSNPRSFRALLFIDDAQRLFKRFHLVFQFRMRF